MGPAISRRSTLLFGNRLLLDQHGGAAAAYSLRKLSSSYEGSAVRVLRTSDASEQDIGFSGGELDTTSLLSFVGAGDGLVTTWYDQSGNSNDATQAAQASMPKLADAGSLVTDNNRPSLDFSASNLINLGGFSIALTSYTVFSVYNPNDTESDTLLYLLGGNAQGFYVGGSVRDGIGASSPPIEMKSNHEPISQTLAVWTNDKIFANGVELNLTEAGPVTSITVTTIGSREDRADSLDQYLQSLIIYPSDESTNRTSIEANINDYYSIY